MPCHGVPPQSPDHAARTRRPPPLHAAIPPELRHHGTLRLPAPLADPQLAARLLELAAPNTHLDEAVCFLGGGTRDHHVPAIVDLVAHAAGHQPVGPASPQPLLQTVFELQTLFAALMDLRAATAPFADGPSALAAAIRAAAAATGRSEAVLARSLNPRYRAVARTLLAPSLGVHEVGYHGGITRPGDVDRLLTPSAACLVVEAPNYFGCLEDLPALARAAHRHGAWLIVKADPIACGIIRPPGSAGADAAVADAQPLGFHPTFGTPALGLLACRPELSHAVPGWRVERRHDTFAPVGQTTACIPADRLVRPAAYLAAVGGEGLAHVATLSMATAHEAHRRITSLDGFQPRFRAPFFCEFAIECHAEPGDVADALLDSNLLGALPLGTHYPEMDHCVLFAATERRTPADVGLLHHTLEFLAEMGGGGAFAPDLGNDG